MHHDDIIKQHDYIITSGARYGDRIIITEETGTAEQHGDSGKQEIKSGTFRDFEFRFWDSGAVVVSCWFDRVWMFRHSSSWFRCS